MSFYMCRPMTFREWMMLPPRARTTIYDMTDGLKKKPRPARKGRKGRK